MAILPVYSDWEPSAYSRDVVGLEVNEGKEMGTVKWKRLYLYLYLLSYETLKRAILWFEIKPGPLALH